MRAPGGPRRQRRTSQVRQSIQWLGQKKSGKNEVAPDFGDEGEDASLAAEPEPAAQPQRAPRASQARQSVAWLGQALGGVLHPHDQGHDQGADQDAAAAADSAVESSLASLGGQSTSRHKHNYALDARVTQAVKVTARCWAQGPVAGACAAAPGCSLRGSRILHGAGAPA